MNIVITGFMASGKSTVAKEISRLTGRTLIDTDEMIASEEGMSINEIFAQHGEKYFRTAEHNAIEKISLLDNVIISTGGGTVLNKRNIELLRKNGMIFYLDADFSVIEERITEAAKTRPLLRDSSIEDIRRRFEERIPYYADCDYRVRIGKDKTPIAAAREIINAVKYY